MFVIVTLIVAAVLVCIVVLAEVPWNADPHLGQMSHQWLAEYRAMHSS